MDWYERNIEEGIRDLVRLLRDNGFNTTCSCEHDMSIQCQYIPDGSIKELHDLLYNYLHKNKLPIDYRIHIRINVRDGRMMGDCIEIRFGKEY